MRIHKKISYPYRIAYCFGNCKKIEGEIEKLTGNLKLQIQTLQKSKTFSHLPYLAFAYLNGASAKAA